VLSHAPPPSQPERQVRMDTKKCNRCGESKSTDEFRLRVVGRKNPWRQTKCKACERAVASAYYEANTEKCKAMLKAYSKSAAGREAQQKYRQSEKGRQYNREFSRAYRRHLWQNCPEARLKMCARHSVGMALLSGKLTRPTICQHCGGHGPIEAHHHRGYDRKYWRDVAWLCRACHRTAEDAIREVAAA